MKDLQWCEKKALLLGNEAKNAFFLKDETKVSINILLRNKFAVLSQ